MGGGLPLKALTALYRLPGTSFTWQCGDCTGQFTFPLSFDISPFG
jgi:hypothetical protein